MDKPPNGLIWRSLTEQDYRGQFAQSAVGWSAAHWSHELIDRKIKHLLVSLPTVRFHGFQASKSLYSSYGSIKEVI